MYCPCQGREVDGPETVPFIELLKIISGKQVVCGQSLLFLLNLELFFGMKWSDTSNCWPAPDRADPQFEAVLLQHWQMLCKFKQISPKLF